MKMVKYQKYYISKTILFLKGDNIKRFVV